MLPSVTQGSPGFHHMHCCNQPADRILKYFIFDIITVECPQPINNMDKARSTLCFQRGPGKAIAAFVRAPPAHAGPGLRDCLAQRPASPGKPRALEPQLGLFSDEFTTSALTRGLCAVKRTPAVNGSSVFVYLILLISPLL